MPTRTLEFIAYGRRFYRHFFSFTLKFFHFTKLNIAFLQRFTFSTFTFVRIHIRLNRNTNNARGKMTPQWRLSLKDLGQSGNGTVPPQNNARKNLRGHDKTLVRRSWEQVIKQQRRGDGNAFASEMRQQRIHTVEKNQTSSRMTIQPDFCSDQRRRRFV